jgi:SAM-dependent methyltransferase
MLVDPHPEAIRELKGMAVEAKLAESAWREVKITTHERLDSLPERIQEATDVGQYYRQTEMNFEQALSTLGPVRGLRALEVGADFDYHFLKRLRDGGAACVACNLHFQRERSGSYTEWPQKVLGDMNDLPFRDGVFDLVLYSATSHHSPDLDKTVSEVARVLAPAGRALFLSDQIGGIFKRLGGPLHQHARDDLVHENEFPIWRYHRAFRRHGFRPRYLFSAFYDEKLRSRSVHTKARFARLGRAVSYAWQMPAVREFASKRMLLPAHLLFGFPMNVILEREHP